MKINIDELLNELWEVNRKAVEASDEFNAEVYKITRRETKKAINRGTIDEVTLDTVVRSVIDKSPKISQLIKKQKFFSSEVLRISALLQGLAARKYLMDSGFRRNTI
jgi:hypothetical protein